MTEALGTGGADSLETWMARRLVGEMSRGGTGVHLGKGSFDFLSPELLLAKAAC